MTIELDIAEIANRRPVWEALSDLFLDTDRRLLENGASNYFQIHIIR
jgi:hypothetical protein